MKKWYISCNFNPLQVEKIARLCTVLEQNQQMLLCGKNLCSNGVMTKEHYQKIDTEWKGIEFHLHFLPSYNGESARLPDVIPIRRIGF